VTTITFYSYKGGVGRSLAVANVAKYLAGFGQRVFAIDLDLEAPGLHYKFALDAGNGAAQIKQGVVDYISAFRTGGKPPDSLSGYVVAVEIADKEASSGRIWLMPAGSVPSASYWRRLAKISWHDLFYSDAAPGVPLFLELKQQIEQQFKPDFLLIDSRTGVTEIGGVATTVVPDKLVCLLTKNRENLDGAREVLRSIKRVPRLPGQPEIEVVPVLTRIPEISETGREEEVVTQVREFLNEPAPDLSMTLNVNQVFVLHSEAGLELAEALRIGGEMAAEDSPLLRDYLRLFTRLVPREVIDPHLDRLVQRSLEVESAFRMPRASDSAIPSRQSLTPSVGIVSLIGYPWFTIISILFLTASFMILAGVIITSFFDPGWRTADLVQSHLWQLLGFSTGSGGIGLYMKRLSLTESSNILTQQLLDSLERLPDSRQKEKAILECARVLVKKHEKTKA